MINMLIQRKAAVQYHAKIFKGITALHRFSSHGYIDPIDGLTTCCVPKTINSVSFKFKRSLFPQSHSDRLVSSIFNFNSTSINCAEEKKITVSSAYIITLEKLMHDGRSLIYSVNNTGPRMLPWGTPFSTARGLDKLVPNDTTWDLLDS